MRETCEDNPLLADCPYSNMGTPTPAPVEPETIPDDEPQFIAAAQNVLSTNCGGCHGSALTEAQALGAINYIDDWDELIQAGLVEECSPGSSPIIGIMRSGEMPPAASGLNAVSDADISVVANAIELSCRYTY
jgi:mono/diheme cytochrome c family protein